MYSKDQNPFKIETSKVKKNKVSQCKIINKKSDIQEKNDNNADLQRLQNLLENGFNQLSSSINNLSVSMRYAIDDLWYSLRNEIKEGNQKINDKLDKILDINSNKISFSSQETLKSLLNIMEKGKKAKEKEETMNIKDEDLKSKMKNNNEFHHPYRSIQIGKGKNIKRIKTFKFDKKLIEDAGKSSKGSSGINFSKVLDRGKIRERSSFTTGKKYKTDN